MFTHRCDTLMPFDYRVYTVYMYTEITENHIFNLRRLVTNNLQFPCRVSDTSDQIKCWSDRRWWTHNIFFLSYSYVFIIIGTFIFIIMQIFLYLRNSLRCTCTRCMFHVRFLIIVTCCMVSVDYDKTLYLA